MAAKQPFFKSLLLQPRLPPQPPLLPVVPPLTENDGTKSSVCLYSQHHDHLIVSNTAFVAKYNHSWVDFIRYGRGTTGSTMTMFGKWVERRTLDRKRSFGDGVKWRLLPISGSVWMNVCVIVCEICWQIITKTVCVCVCVWCVCVACLFVFRIMITDTFRSTWGRRQGSNNALFPPK